MKRQSTLVILTCLCALLGLHVSAATAQPAYDDYADEQGPVVMFNGKQYIRVTEPKQFVRSIISGQNVLVARHTQINLSTLLEDEGWWQRKTIFEWLESNQIQNLVGQCIVSEGVFDGRQLTIVGYKNITIEGECSSSIIVDPRYAFCLNFVNCENVTIKNLTIGHAEEDGYCQGGVIGATGCKGLKISDCNLYGCGAYGLQLNNTSDVYMEGSAIHDCTYGIMTLNNVKDATFFNCNFYRNREFSLIDGVNSDISFSCCNFYANRHESPLFNIDRKFSLTSCNILHPTESLGTIDMATDLDNRFLDDPEATDCLDMENPYIGTGHGMEKVIVNYSGAKPTIVDFISSITGYMGTVDGELEYWERVWEDYQQTKRIDEDVNITVDERNGYVRIQPKTDNGEVMYHDFCYWNCSDGRHKLIAHSNGLIVDGKAVATETTGLMFYIYDNDTNLITLLGSEETVMGSEPDEGYEFAFQLPRTGKDISYVTGSGKCGTVKWNGKGFSVIKPISQLPKTAQRTDANDKYAVYVNKEEDGISTVWLVDKAANTVERVCVTWPGSPALWCRMPKETSNGIEVPLYYIATAEKAWIVPGEGRKVVVEGCPDARNTWTYIIDVDSHKAWQLPSQEGVVSIGDANQPIIVASYGYDDDGRYTYNRAYSTEGTFVRMVGQKERE